MKSLFYFTLFTSVVIASCKKEKPTEPITASSVSSITSSTAIICGTSQNQILLAGQTINSGSVSVSNDQVNLYVKYSTSNGWVLNKTHLYVGDCELIPKTKAGNPQIGLFPFQQTYSPNNASATYTIPLSSLDSCYCIAAHAEVSLLNSSGSIIQTETGWAQGGPMGGNSWAMVFNYCTQSCTQTPTCNILPGDFRTQTQGGWGATPNDNNPAAYLQANFASVFPTGLTVGCSTGNALKFTSANAIINFLPQGGTASALIVSYINPLTVNNVFAGWTVMQLLNEVNQILGGCNSNYTFSQLNTAVTSVNENFDNGTIVGSFLTCH